jgi:hypothetical protein
VSLFSRLPKLLWCRGCGRELPRDMFRRDPRSATGRSNRCRACIEERKARQYNARAERERGLQNDWLRRHAPRREDTA